jgi:hypothetical protein
MGGIVVFIILLSIVARGLRDEMNPQPAAAVPAE